MLSIKEEREQHLADAAISFTKVVNQNWSDHDIRNPSNIAELCQIFSEMISNEKRVFKRKVRNRTKEIKSQIDSLQTEIASHNHISAKQTNDVIIANNAFRRGIIEHRNILNSIERISDPTDSKLKHRLTRTDMQLKRAKQVVRQAKLQTSAMKGIAESLRSTMDILVAQMRMELSDVRRHLSSHNTELFTSLQRQQELHESTLKRLSSQIAEARKSSIEMKHAISDFLSFLDPDHMSTNTELLFVGQYVDNLVKKAKREVIKQQTKSSISSKKKLASIYKEQLKTTIRVRESELYSQFSRHQNDLDELQDALSNVMQANPVKRRSVVFDLPEKRDDSWWEENIGGIARNLREMNAMMKKYVFV